MPCHDDAPSPSTNCKVFGPLPPGKLSRTSPGTPQHSGHDYTPAPPSVKQCAQPSLLPHTCTVPSRRPAVAPSPLVPPQCNCGGCTSTHPVPPAPLHLPSPRSGTERGSAGAPRPNCQFPCTCLVPRAQPPVRLRRLPGPPSFRRQRPEQPEHEGGTVPHPTVQPRRVPLHCKCSSTFAVVRQHSKSRQTAPCRPRRPAPPTPTPSPKVCFAHPCRPFAVLDGAIRLRDIRFPQLDSPPHPQYNILNRIRSASVCFNDTPHLLLGELGKRAERMASEPSTP